MLSPNCLFDVNIILRITSCPPWYFNEALSVLVKFGWCWANETQEQGEMVLSDVGCFCNSMAWNSSSLSLSVHLSSEKLQFLRISLGMFFSRCDPHIHFLVVRKVEGGRDGVHERLLVQDPDKSVTLQDRRYCATLRRMLVRTCIRILGQLKKDGKGWVERRQLGHFLGWAVGRQPWEKDHCQLVVWKSTKEVHILSLLAISSPHTPIWPWWHLQFFFVTDSFPWWLNLHFDLISSVVLGLWVIFLYGEVLAPPLWDLSTPYTLLQMLDSWK